MQYNVLMLMIVSDYRQSTVELIFKCKYSFNVCTFDLHLYIANLCYKNSPNAVKHFTFHIFVKSVIKTNIMFVSKILVQEREETFKFVVAMV